MKSPLKNLKKYFQLIMTALICFVMGVIEDKKRICIKDTDSKKDRTVLRPDDKKNNRKNKIKPKYIPAVLWISTNRNRFSLTGLSPSVDGLPIPFG